MALKSDLVKQLLAMDGLGYGEYKRIKNSYSFPDFDLRVDYVQGDPFAAPSLVRIFSGIHATQYDDWYFTTAPRTVALRDFLCRQFERICASYNESCGSGNSGLVGIDSPGQELISRSAVLFHEDRTCEIRFTVGLPANGRRILGKKAARIFGDFIPLIFQKSVPARALNHSELRLHAEVNEDADALRSGLADRGLVAYIANGSFLPRASGISDEPLSSSEAVRFESPTEMEEEFNLPHRGKISGMGIRRGVTLITGGGFHGKSTLLKAIENGIYNHIPGDGREFVVSSVDAVKIRAEDGRSIARVDISPFINNLPTKMNTKLFSTVNASGSTSQAANIIEAIELGCKVILIDEDTSATNFMVRDRRMQELVKSEDEPITPLLDRMKSLVHEESLSMIAVIGGNGDYLDIADCVIGMRNYLPYDLTERSREICKSINANRLSVAETSFHFSKEREIDFKLISPQQGKKKVHIKARNTKEILYGEEVVDVSLCEQFIHRSQLKAIGWAMVRLYEDIGREASLAESVLKIEELVRKHGIETITDEPLGDLVWFRRYELAQVVNRIRKLLGK